MDELLDKIASLDDVEEKYRIFYTQDPSGDGYNLNIRTEAHRRLGETTRKLAEFRDNNRNLKTQADEAADRLSRLGDLANLDEDALAKVQEDLKLAQAVADKKLVEEGRVDELIANKTRELQERHKADMQAQQNAYKELQTKYETTAGNFNRLQVTTDLAKAVNKTGFGVQKGAMPDLEARALGVWGFDEEGNMRARQNGELLLGEGAQPMTMDEWVATQVQEAKHLFVASQGGGGGGGNNPQTPAGGTVTPGQFESGAASLEDVAAGRVRVQAQQ